jgi:hypothetical protein
MKEETAHTVRTGTLGALDTEAVLPTPIGKAG